MIGYEDGDLLLIGAADWPTVGSLPRPACAGCGRWPGWLAAPVSDESAYERRLDRRTTGLTAGLTAYATMRYISRLSLPFL